jgi:cyclopropane-fatty-acyl-phospholipid synthase
MPAVGANLRPASPDTKVARAVAPPRPSTLPFRVVDDAARLLRRLFRSFDGTLALRLWDGTNLKVGKAIPGQPAPRFTLVFRNPRVVCSLVLGSDPLRLAEAYFHDDIDIKGDFFAALSLKDYLRSIRMPLHDRLGALLAVLRLQVINRNWDSAHARRAALRARSVRTHSKSENRSAIQFHYDVSNEFYALWLGESMVYSCAYFAQPHAELEQAQHAKLDHICRKLLLKPGDSFLDVGCGWGALVIHAAKHYGVQAHGITLSQQQLDFARQRIAQAGLEDRVTVELRDYRDLKGEAVYDKVASVGMFEHVGLKNLPVYFSTIHRLLKPSGLFLNHGITSDVEGWTKTPFTEFINRYVFPDGQLDTISNIQRVMESSSFEIADVEGLRAHYALTLRRWVARLERHHAEALQYVNESTYRVWRLYMAACAVEFESGEIGVYQVLASKRAASTLALPLTREHLYNDKAA